MMEARTAQSASSREKARLRENCAQQYIYYVKASPRQIWQYLSVPGKIGLWFFEPEHFFFRKNGACHFGRAGDMPHIQGKFMAILKDQEIVQTFRFGSEEFAGDPESTVSYSLEAVGRSMTALQVVHTFPRPCKSAEHARGVWPCVLSHLKTLLETGRHLPWPTHSKSGE